GPINAARRCAAPLSRYRWTNESGAVLRSPLGHGYVFGGGYGDALGSTLIATGPLFVWRYEPFERVETTGSHDDPELASSVYALSERLFTVAYECAVFAVTIDPEAEAADGLLSAVRDGHRNADLHVRAEQNMRVDSEHVRDPLHGAQRQVPPPALDPAPVRAMKSELIRQRLLAQPARRADAPDVFAHDALQVTFHDVVQVARTRLSGLQTHAPTDSIDTQTVQYRSHS